MDHIKIALSGIYSTAALWPWIRMFRLEINFEILFRNLQHVLVFEILQKKFHLWSAVIGQSASVYKHRIKRRRCCLHI